MKMILLFIRKNFRYRKANYVLPFLSFVLSGILLCTSVFYLTLAFDYNTVSQNDHPYDMVMKSGNTHDDAVIAEAMRDNMTFTGGYVQPYIDLMPHIRAETEAFDDAIVHKQLNFASIRPTSPLAAFYNSYGCDLSVLAPNEVYIAPYILYYFQNHIENDILTVSAPQENGGVFRLNIVGIIDERICDDGSFAVICADEALFASMQTAYDAQASLHFYDFADGFVHSRENYSAALQNLWKTEDSVDVRLHSRAPIEESHAIYSGDAAIAVFNIFFAILCIVSTLKLKLSRELPDYRKLFSLGLSPVLRFLIPFCDIGMLIVPAYLIAFPFSVWLFSVIAPYDGQIYQTGVITHYFQYSHELLITTLLLFVGCVVSIAGILIAVCIVRNAGVRHSYVRQSARIYTSSKFHLLPYTLLRVWRNRKYNLFFLFILCFPLFVVGMYGTAAMNLTSSRGGLFADAAYIISREDVAYGSAVTDRTVHDIRALQGVESVQVIHKTNTRYTFTKDEMSVGAQMMELNDAAAVQFSRYLTGGSLDAVRGDSHAIAVVDEQGSYSLGDTVTVKETGQRFTVAAILKQVPLDGRPMTYLVNFEALEKTGQATCLPTELYVYLDPTVTDAEYAALNSMIPSLVYDPHASFINQKDETAALNADGGVTYRVAAAMNIQICIISVLSVFLFHTQKQTERTREFEILFRLGYSHRKIRALICTESVLLLGIGFCPFGLLYGAYVSSITNAIRASGAYQYIGFSHAWKEMICISLGMIGVVGISDLVSYRPQKT